MGGQQICEYLNIKPIYPLRLKALTTSPCGLIDPHPSKLKETGHEMATICRLRLYVHTSRIVETPLSLAISLRAGSNWTFKLNRQESIASSRACEEDSRLTEWEEATGAL